MPELRFSVRWPDGSVGSYYSPSTIIREHLTVDTDYTVTDFLTRARTALAQASERVRAKYGFSCSAARATLAELETTAARFADQGDAVLRVML